MSANGPPNGGGSPISGAPDRHPEPRWPHRRWFAFAAIAAAAGGLGAWTGWRRFAPDQGDDGVADLLFALNLPAPDNRPIDLNQWRGRPLVVNFWATWCAPCVEEMPELSAFQQQYASTGLQILGIGIDSPDNIRQFSQQRPVAYPLLMAGAGGSELSRRFGNKSGGLPYTVVIDRKGRVTTRIIGRFRAPELRSAIEAVSG